MRYNPFILLTERRFLPLFITQFMGAFNDNLYKNALIVLIMYQLAPHLAVSPQILVVLAGCLLVVPMLLFSAQAGAMADKFEKSQLIRLTKMLEIMLMMVGAWGFFLKNVWLLMTILFFLGVQSTLFGPLKYSILPFHLRDDELIAGNSLIEMGTFLAILLGNILGAILIVKPQGLWIVSSFILIVAIVGFISSCYIPCAQASMPNLRLSCNVVKETLSVLRLSKQSPAVFLCIIGISWFWLVGFVFLAEFPDYAKNYVGGNAQVFVIFLTVFSIGIGVGSVLCNRLLQGRIEATYVPLATLGMSIFIFDLYMASQNLHPDPHAALLTVSEFFYYVKHWRIVVDMLLISICAGIYIVPLYAIVQHKASDGHKARIIASVNIMNALFMVLAAVITMVLLRLKLTIPHIFLILGIMNLVVMFYMRRLLPKKHSKSSGKLII